MQAGLGFEASRFYCLRSSWSVLYSKAGLSGAVAHERGSSTKSPVHLRTVAHAIAPVCSERLGLDKGEHNFFCISAVRVLQGVLSVRHRKPKDPEESRQTTKIHQKPRRQRRVEMRSRMVPSMEKANGESRNETSREPGGRLDPALACTGRRLSRKPRPCIRALALCRPEQCEVMGRVDLHHVAKRPTVRRRCIYQEIWVQKGGRRDVELRVTGAGLEGF